MAITLGELLTFCQEVASPDASGDTAVREFLVWINAALQRLYNENGWDRTLREEKLTIPPRETGSDLNLTQGSLTITRDTAFDAKYLSDRWGLFVGGEDRVEFELGAIGAESVAPFSATLRTGDEWIAASATDQTYYFCKNKIAFPQAREVFRVQVLDTALEVSVLKPADFDRIKAVRPTTMTSYPTICTFRRGRLELWPHPGPNYSKLSITYRSALVTRMTWADSTDDADEVPWDEEAINVLHKAILLEAAITQGRDGAPIPYEVALVEYNAALQAEKNLADRDNMNGPINLRLPSRHPRGGGWGHIGEIVDA